MLREDFRCKPYVDRKAALRLVRHGRGTQYVVHAEGHGDRLFEAVADLALSASFLRNWMRPIVRGRRKPGSKSKTRRPPLQPIHLVGFSNSGSMKILRRQLKFIIQGSTR
jgi:hypothetical protein